MSETKPAKQFEVSEYSPEDAWMEGWKCGRDETRAELDEWKAAFKIDDREGDSRLMARAMGQAMDALRDEVERLREALRTIKDDTDDTWALDVATAALAATGGQT